MPALSAFRQLPAHKRTSAIAVLASALLLLGGMIIYRARSSGWDEMVTRNGSLNKGTTSTPHFDLGAIARDPVAQAAYFKAQRHWQAVDKDQEKKEDEAQLLAIRRWEQSSSRYLFPTSAGRIRYRINIAENRPLNPEKTRETLEVAWNDYGRYFRQDHKIAPLEDTSTPDESIEHRTVIGDETSLYILPPERGGGPARLIGPFRHPVSNIVASIPRPLEPQDQIRNLLRFLPPADLMPGDWVGGGTVLGRPCAVYKAFRQRPDRSFTRKLWLWHGIVLRSELAIANNSFWGMADNREKRIHIRPLSRISPFQSIQQHRPHGCSTCRRAIRFETPKLTDRMFRSNIQLP